ncbi:MAG: hypothetical protein ACREP9_15555, partial [Candidatus Dormibacteraceae bacterium]
GAAVFSECGSAIVSLLEVPIPFYRWNGIILAVLLAIFLWWLLVPGRQRAAPVSGKSESLP